MKFEVEFIMSDFEIKTNYPIDSIHIVNDWNYGNPVERKGKVVGYKPPMPTNSMASFPRVVFEEISLA